MLHHARVVLAVAAGVANVGWYISPPALCCTSAPLSNPSISRGLNFPPFTLLLSFHFLLSLFSTSRLWLSLVPVNPTHHLPIHPPPSENHQLSFSPHTSLTQPWCSHSWMLLFLHRSVLHAGSSSSIYSSKLIIFVASLLPPTVCDHHVCQCALVVFFSLHQPLFPISPFPPPSLSPISSAAQSGLSMLIDLKAIISEKKSQQGFLSYQIWLVSFEHILSNNPSFPRRSHGFLFVRWANLFRFTWFLDHIKSQSFKMFLLYCKIQLLVGLQSCRFSPPLDFLPSMLVQKKLQLGCTVVGVLPSLSQSSPPPSIQLQQFILQYSSPPALHHYPWTTFHTC